MTHTQTNTALAWNDKRADSKTFPFLSAMKHACAHTHMWTHAHTHSDCWYLKVSAERRSVIRDVNDVHITKSRLLKIVLPFHLSPLRRAPSLSPKASPASMWRNTHVISCDTACRAHARTLHIQLAQRDHFLCSYLNRSKVCDVMTLDWCKLDHFDLSTVYRRVQLPSCDRSRTFKHFNLSGCSSPKL